MVACILRGNLVFKMSSAMRIRLIVPDSIRSIIFDEFLKEERGGKELDFIFEKEGFRREFALMPTL